jgi:hypothetical protein
LEGCKPSKQISFLVIAGKAGNHHQKIKGCAGMARSVLVGSRGLRFESRPLGSGVIAWQCGECILELETKCKLDFLK